MPSCQEEYQQLIDDCMDRQSQLNDWEISFLDSINDQVAEEGTLSDRQFEKLESIWERVTENG